MKVRIVGTKVDMDVDPLIQFKHKGKDYFIHIGHNRLIPSLVVADKQTGKPVKIYATKKGQDIDVKDYVRRFKQDLTGVK